jgi:hypothetical protein
VSLISTSVAALFGSLEVEKRRLRERGGGKKSGRGGESDNKGTALSFHLSRLCASVICSRA